MTADQASISSPAGAAVRSVRAAREPGEEPRANRQRHRMSPFDRGLVGAASFLVAGLACAAAAAVGFTGWTLVIVGAGAAGATSMVLGGLRAWTDRRGDREQKR